MCNLNCLISKGGFTLNELEGLLYSSAVSYGSHNYSEGIYTYPDNCLKKGASKLKLMHKAKELSECSLIMMHERTATSGFNAKSAQPFKSKDGRFVFAHNGIFDIKTSLSAGDKSDSAIFFKCFCREFAKLGNVTEAIKATFKVCCDSEGFFSFLLWDSVKKELLYLKNSRADIHISQLKSGAYFITTNRGNSSFFEVKTPYIIEDLKPYRFELNAEGELILYQYPELSLEYDSEVYRCPNNGYPISSIVWDDKEQRYKGWKKGEMEIRNYPPSFYDNECFYE